MFYCATAVRKVKGLGMVSQLLTPHTQERLVTQLVLIGNTVVLNDTFETDVRSMDGRTTYVEHRVKMIQEQETQANQPHRKET